MARKSPKVEDAWTNRFQTPTVEALTEALQLPARDLFTSARMKLDEVEDTICEIRWLGVPWRWSLLYALKGETDDALAYLVPDPQKPQLCVPMDCESLERVAPKRLSRAIRDGIVFAAEVGGTRWASWELQSETQIDEILTLARAKVEHRATTA